MGTGGDWGVGVWGLQVSESKSQLAVHGYPRQPASEITQLTFPADVELIVIVNFDRDFCSVLYCLHALKAH